MASLRNAFLISAIVCLLGLSRHAVMATTAQDYLLVSTRYTYSAGTFSNLYIEQQALSVSPTLSTPSSPYEMLLYGPSGVISRSFFEIPKGADQYAVEVDPASGKSVSSSRPAPFVDILVKLPLIESVAVSDAGIRIQKGSQVVFNMPLSALSLSIVTKSVNTIATASSGRPAAVSARSSAVQVVPGSGDFLSDAGAGDSATKGPVAVKKGSGEETVLIVMAAVGSALLALMWFGRKK